MAVIPQIFLDSVVALGIPEEGKINWTATGFLYGRVSGKNELNQPTYLIFLVTNRHVVFNQPKLMVRFNPRGITPAKDYPLAMADESKRVYWTAHPDPSVDISVTEMSTSFLQQDNKQFGFFEEDNHAYSAEELNSGTLNEGDPVFVLGYPMGLVSPDRQYVIVRGGVISRIRDWKDGLAKDFLVDATVFPGNSGGPVINGFSMTSVRGTSGLTRICLLGMVKSYIPYHDRAISPQTGRTRVVFEENSGLTSVVPAKLIKETVDLCFQNNRRPSAGTIEAKPESSPIPKPVT